MVEKKCDSIRKLMSAKHATPATNFQCYYTTYLVIGSISVFCIPGAVKTIKVNYKIYWLEKNSAAAILVPYTKCEFAP